ncbi:putative RNA-directed DNA polymerase from transposon BS [Trichonephila clavipes]|nr:putative RNA-directed DNA polymerase from transposon BS [Trichonephila clavipes]
MKRAKNIIHGCRTSDVRDQGLSRDFSQQELLLAMAVLDMTKSPCPDGVFGRMLENLGHRGKLRLLDIINLSWKIGRLPAEWKRAIIIPIKKAGKNNWSPKDFRPIALTTGIEKIPSVEMRVGLFADDIVIWCSGRDLVEMERNLNNALSSFSDYALEFKLCF